MKPLGDIEPPPPGWKLGPSAEYDGPWVEDKGIRFVREDGTGEPVTPDEAWRIYRQETGKASKTLPRASCGPLDKLREAASVAAVGMEVVEVLETTRPDEKKRLGVMFDDGHVEWGEMDEDEDDGRGKP